MAEAICVFITPPTSTSPPYLPPPVGISHQEPYSAYAEATQDRHPLRHLIRLRDEAAAEVERLLAFLDATDGDTDLEPYLTGWNGEENDDREGDPADDRQEDDGESGIADPDGLMEQYPKYFAHCDQRLES